MPPRNDFRRAHGLKQPCADCPFRDTDPPFPLGYERRKQIADSIVKGDTFHCHKTVRYSDDEAPDVEASLRCYGAAKTAHDSGLPPSQMEQIGVRLSLMDAPNYDLPGDTYDTIDLFVHAED